MIEDNLWSSIKQIEQNDIFQTWFWNKSSSISERKEALTPYTRKAGENDATMLFDSVHSKLVNKQINSGVVPNAQLMQCFTFEFE